MNSIKDSQNSKTGKMTQNEKWWESEWYKEWVKLARRDYHGKRCGWWYCYVDENEEIKYKYIRREEDQ